MMLIRLATGDEELEYQIAPGVSILSKQNYSDFGNIATKVCFLLDGDDAGDKLKALKALGNTLHAGLPRDDARMSRCCIRRCQERIAEYFIGKHFRHLPLG